MLRRLRPLCLHIGYALFVLDTIRSIKSTVRIAPIRIQLLPGVVPVVAGQIGWQVLVALVVTVLTKQQFTVADAIIVDDWSVVKCVDIAIAAMVYVTIMVLRCWMILNRF